MSPTSIARYDAITLHDGWIWANAVVRTGYLANALSGLPVRAQERGLERQRVGGRKHNDKVFTESEVMGVWKMNHLEAPTL